MLESRGVALFFLLATALLNLGCSSFLYDAYLGPKWLAFALFPAPLLMAIGRHRPLHGARVLAGLTVLCLALLITAVGNGEGTSWPDAILWFAGVGWLWILTQESETYLELYAVALEWSTVAVLALMSFEAIGIELLTGLPRSPGRDLSSFFGNSGMAATFLSLSLICTLTLPTRLTPRRNLPRYLLAGATLIAILFLRSRASLVALAASAIGAACFGRRTVQRALLGGLIIAAIASIALISNSPTKSYSASMRLLRWKNTLSMITENPLGVGVGNFRKAYLHYYRRHGVDSEVTEWTLLTQPHNEYLRALAEFGLVPVFISLALLVIILRGRIVMPPGQTGPLILICIAVDAVFNGTFSSPPVVLASIVGLAQIIRVDHEHAIPRNYSLAFALLLLVGAGILSTLFILEGRPDLMPDGLRRQACQATPSWYRICIDLATDDIAAQKYDAAAEELQLLLSVDQTNFTAWRLLAFVQGARERNLEACAALGEYQKIFRGETQYSGQFRALCP